MSSEPTKISGVKCHLDNHYHKELKWICSNPNCPNKRLGCNKCITLLHRNCIDFMLHIDELYKKSFKNNANWIHNKEIREAILMLEKYSNEDFNDIDNEIDDEIMLEGVSNSVIYEKLQKGFEENLNKEFDLILGFIKDKIIEVKDSIKCNYLQHLQHNEQLNVKPFVNKLKEYYSFDKIVNMYNELKMDNVTLNDINYQFNDIIVKNPKSGEIELEKLGHDISEKLVKNTVVDHVIFEDFKKHVTEIFEPLKLYVPQKKKWGWDSNHKAKGIILSEKNSKAMKNDTTMGYTAVIGDVKMKKGKFIWEINVNSGNTTHQWMSFGIIDFSVVSSYENFPYSSTYGLTTYGQLYQMSKSTNSISEYDNKTFRCELNFVKGTFEISHEGNLICSVNNLALKDKTMVPFAILYRQSNTVMLKVIESVAPL